MFIQSAPAGEAHFVIKQIDHARLSGTLARAFGGGGFAPLAPADPMHYMVAHHDEGWQFLDDAPPFDPATGLPYHLTQTPLPLLLRTGKGSPDFNEKYHPYSGLLASMHITGLYNGRYGMSNFVFIENIPPQYADAARALLEHEANRQAFLRSVCANRPDCAHESDEGHVMCNYKRLQFFDTLAIYFHLRHPAQQIEQVFTYVPRTLTEDVNITIKPLGDQRFGMSPWPFAGGPTLEVSCVGRYLHPAADEAAMRTAWEAAPIVYQTYRLEAL